MAKKIKHWEGGEHYKEGHETLNDSFRNGGDIKEDQEPGGHDTLSKMSLASKRSDVLARQLAEMGWSASGDEPELD